jgi:hypothetical protein
MDGRLPRSLRYATAEGAVAPVGMTEKERPDAPKGGAEERSRAAPVPPPAGRRDDRVVMGEEKA